MPYGSGLRVLLDVIKETPARTPSPTTRERQVLHLISPRTVENHKRQIFAKLDVHSQAHAVRLGLIDV